MQTFQHNYVHSGGTEWAHGLGCPGQWVCAQRLRATTRNFVGLDSKMQRLGGNPQLTGHARSVSAWVGRGAKSSGKGTKATSHARTLLIRRTLSHGDFSPLWVDFFRGCVVKASKSARTEKQLSPSSSPYALHWRSCLPTAQNNGGEGGSGRRPPLATTRERQYDIHACPVSQLLWV